MIERKPFGTTMAGEPVEEYVLSGARGASLHLLSYGATAARLRVPDRSGQVGDVLLGFDDLRGFELSSPYFGATIGRVGNRIADGTFTVDGRKYHVPLNNGLNHLHGGLIGYDKRVWRAEMSMSGGPSVRFSLVDPDGSEGYPGTIHASVIYTLADFGAGVSMKIQYFATTTAAKPINLTNHPYFNLKDAGATDVLGHELQLFAAKYTPVNADLIPTGELASVAGTPMDFQSPQAIGARIGEAGGGMGYDHNYVLNSRGKSFAQAAAVHEPTTGRLMEVWTTEPGVQLYSGNFLNGSFKGRGGVA